MTFIYNNLWLILASILIAIPVIGFVIIIIHLPKMGLMATPYRPPLPRNKLKRGDF